VLSDDALATLSIDAVVEALRADRTSLSGDEAQRLCANLPALATAEASLALFERLVPHDGNATDGLIWHLVRALAGARHLPAIPALRRLRDRRPPDRRGQLTDALFALGDRATLEEVAAALAPTVKALRITWDPHHTTDELRDPIRAAFARAPERATEAFAPYFTPKALASEKGAKVALDILLLGERVVVDHHGTRLETSDPSWLERDPRWGEVLARLTTHARLGPTARRLARRAGTRPSAAAPAAARRGTRAR